MGVVRVGSGAGPGQHLTARGLAKAAAVWGTSPPRQRGPGEGSEGRWEVFVMLVREGVGSLLCCNRGALAAVISRD